MEATHKATLVPDHRRGFHLTTMNDISAEAQISSEHLDDLRQVLEHARRAPTLTASQIRERQLAMLRTLRPLLFSRTAPPARVEQNQP